MSPVLHVSQLSILLILFLLCLNVAGAKFGLFWSQSHLLVPFNVTYVNNKCSPSTTPQSYWLWAECGCFSIEKLINLSVRRVTRPGYSLFVWGNFRSDFLSFRVPSAHSECPPLGDSPLAVSLHFCYSNAEIKCYSRILQQCSPAIVGCRSHVKWLTIYGRNVFTLKWQRVREPTF